jgi:hypothetical protein
MSYYFIFKTLVMELMERVKNGEDIDPKQQLI